MSRDHIQFLQDTYQSLLGAPSFQDEGLGREEIIFDIMLVMSDVLSKCGIEHHQVSLLIEMIDTGSPEDTPQLAYIDYLCIDQTSFDLFGNIGKKNIVEGYLDRHKPDAAYTWIEKEDNLDNSSAYGDPINWPWKDFVESRIIAFHQSMEISKKTPSNLHSHRSIRI